MLKFQKIEDKKEWQGLLDKALFKTFFHSLDWESFLEKEFGWLRFERYIYEDKALLCLARYKIFGREKLISHPFCEYGGPLPLREKIDFQKFQENVFSEFKVPIRISFHPQILNFFENVPRTILGTLRETYFIRGLNQKNEEIIWRDLRKTTRHEIKKARESGLKIEKCERESDLKVFYDLYIKTSKNHKVPAYPFSFLQYFWRSPDSEIILAKFQNQVIAGSVFLFYPVESREAGIPPSAELFNGVNDKFIHYFLNASDKKYKNLGANHLILLSQIENYCGKEYRVFDLGGTRAGSRLGIFKEGWGGEKKPIIELTNSSHRQGFRGSPVRKVFGLLPCFLIKKLSPHLLKYKLF